VLDRGVSVNLAQRARLYLGLATLCFSVLVARLWHLQIMNGSYFRDRSENNRTRIVYTPAPRGMIYDRHGELLVQNRPSYNVEFIPEDAPNPEVTLQNLARIAQVPVEKLAAGVKDQIRRRRFEPKILLRDVPRDLVGIVKAHMYELPGVIISVAPARQYVYGDLAAHVLGYIREVTPEQLKSSTFAGYRSGDAVGQYGLETKWERLLRGERGVQGIVVNALGTRTGELFFQPEIPGHNLTLTIDRRLQQAADLALVDKRGAIVALDVRNGDILALASSPRFDPNIFTGEISREVWADLVAGKENKLTNRAVQGTYPPGSVFKIFVALAALEEELTSSHEKIPCPGFLQFGQRQFRCHKRGGHGSMNLYDSIVRSCDVFFYQIGQRLGVDRIHHHASLFGFGQQTEIGLSEEAAGLVPSTSWKAAYFKDPEQKRWYPGETLPVAIGQGAVLATPLQVARGMAAVVNGGKLLRPRVVRSVVSVQGVTLEERIEPEVIRTLKLNSTAVTLVRQAMTGVVNDAHGTGRRAALAEQSSVLVAGKTGTSQTMSREKMSANDDDHAWFAGYAPADQPEIVVVALVENGGSGGKIAAPLVGEVLAVRYATAIAGSKRADVDETTIEE
jgi:penicillin-binding protein 2